MSIQKIAIVGGGTAGWLAANHLGNALAKKANISITLIESPDIPPIGVGEGTVPNIKKSLKKFGISETEFIRECDVSFKQSIRFVNWMDKKKHGENNFFHHLFDIPTSSDADELTKHWINNHSNRNDKNFADIMSSQHRACEQGKAPKKITTTEYDEELTYAYHLNAGKFAKLLARNATEKFSVNHLITNVTEVKLTNDGAINSLITDSEGELDFDFYIDCTGFEALLIDKALKVPFIDVSDTLLVNTALVVQVPTDNDEIIPPYTIATAHQAGWIWDIALPNRRGVGFVYSNEHMSDSEAEAKLDYYLGDKKKDLIYRKLPMRVGYREKFWHKNCLALGLAQGFLEPLEATSIFLTDLAAKLLAQRFPKTPKQMVQLEECFNQSMTYTWKSVVDFIKLHYCISDRSDSMFWLANREPKTIPNSLQKKLDIWSDFIPVADDFFSQYEVFYLENFLFVLYGMKYPTKLTDNDNADNQKILKRIAQREHLTENLISSLPNHRELLDKIKKFGLQSI